MTFQNSTHLPDSWTSEDFLSNINVRIEEDHFDLIGFFTSTQIPFTTEETIIKERSLGDNVTSIVARTRDIPCQIQIDTSNLILMIFFAIIFCLSVVGNCMVIVTIVQQRWMRTITNMYLLNLAVADVMLSVICMPSTLIAKLLKCFVFGRVMCKVFAYLQPVAVTASAYTLTVIAVERYYAICRPLHSRAWQTKSHALMMIILVWVISLLCNITPLFVYDKIEINKGQYNCRVMAWFTPEANLALQLYITIALFLLPLCIMILLYGKVIVTLRQGMTVDMRSTSIANGNIDEENGNLKLVKSKPKLIQRLGTSIRRLGPTRPPAPCVGRIAKIEVCSDSHGTGSPIKTVFSKVRKSGSEHSHKSAMSDYSQVSLRSTHMEKSLLAKKRVIRMLIAVVIEFFLCWTPIYIYFIVFMAAKFYKVNTYNSTIHVIFMIMSYISSCCNPITYCFLNDKFRQAFLYAFGCRSWVEDRLEQQLKYQSVSAYPQSGLESKGKSTRGTTTRMPTLDEKPDERGEKEKMFLTPQPSSSKRLNVSIVTQFTSSSDDEQEGRLIKKNGNKSWNQPLLHNSSSSNDIDLNHLTAESTL